MPEPTHEETLAERLANSITHGVGAIFSIGGLAVLVGFAAANGDAWHVASVSIFGASLVILYTASTLYHAISHPEAKRILRVIDHSAIFLVIAGTYTPFMLVNLRGPVGWTVFGIIWTLALLGIAYKVTMLGRWKKLALALYLAMGWLVVFAAQPLLEHVQAGGVRLLVYGGLAYTLGVVFFVWRQLPYNHAMWHLFVLTGSVCHFFAVLFFVIPPGQVA